ncbi:acetylglutamate kinase [Chitinivibrio alkaliphilus]|uniref:Acetylglutamate kinase n=1 Tax=Chitinivibrio alkaliphilus ACht1 TaxID=1313304 RepID=U7D7T2_9BACT|nr:acetylglutamate kinase [Chitinivibrio alkaliphilus]ERP31631.1 acetylglutamate kinase [Chitinivibrio alkaliphilus ACht1]
MSDGKKRVLIKIGGSTVNDAGFLESLGCSIQQCASTIDSILVHGGGKDIAAEYARMNTEYSFVDGLRVTDEEMMGGVQRVLSGEVNKRIVLSLCGKGVPALGVSGVDAALLTAEKITVRGHDLGRVGRITQVNSSCITALIGVGYVPVISPVSGDGIGGILNINADDAASEVSVACNVSDLVYVSDVPGVLINDTVVSYLSVEDIEGYIKSGDVTGGMIPKLRSAADSIRRGVGRVHITGWYGDETLEQELSGRDCRGTTIFAGA